MIADSVKQKEQKNDDVDDKTLFDAEFARINAIIRKTDFETTPFERISPQNNAKFILPKAEKGDTSFLDELYKHLSSELPQIHVQKLRDLVESEEYDSDSIKMDVLKYPYFLSKTVNKDCVESILNFVKGTSVLSNTFSVGLRFYYWPHYENMDEIKEIEWNKHDHGGYKVSQLSINAKYVSFKEEITNYRNLNIEQYKQAYAKATIFMKSERIKKMSAKEGEFKNKHLHYAIVFGALVSLNHILSLVLYTDHSEFSRDFSATFRKSHNSETLESIKQRNSLYFWMSKYLRELVELFGQCSWGDTFKQDTIFKFCGQAHDIPLDALHGPFYCGMDYKMNVDSFAMRLNSPTSTSKQFAVAVKFSGQDGVVFTFYNPRSEPQYCFLRTLACSFISHYKEEDECLFFGGFYRIKVVNVLLTNTKENMKKFVAAFYYFDAVLTGANLEKIEKGKNDFLIIDSLIKMNLGKQTNVKLPQFMLDCFKAFTANKKQIIFDMSLLYKYGDVRINNLLFHSLDKREREKEFRRSDDDSKNVVHLKLFALFSNVQSLIIDTRYGFEFCFSLMTLLNVIFETNLNEITIQSIKYIGHCWIKSVAKGYKIQMNVVDDENEYNLKIRRIV